jgi:hypothetical protein
MTEFKTVKCSYSSCPNMIYVPIETVESKLIRIYCSNRCTKKGRKEYIDNLEKKKK